MIWLFGADAVDLYSNTVNSSSAFPSIGIFGTNGTTASQTGKRILNNCLIAPAGVPTIAIFPSPNPTGTLAGLVMDGNYHQSSDGNFLASWNGTSYTSLSAWQTATSSETSGVAAGNCHFVQPQPTPALTVATIAGASVYAPTSGSPLLGAGANLAGTYGITPTPDLLGNPWTQDTIGAINVAGTPDAYAAAVYQDNPIAFWRFAETSGTEFVDTVGGFTYGAWTAATLNQSTLVPGDGAPSVSINGSTAVGTVASSLVSLSAATITAWAKPTTVTGAQIIFDGINVAGNTSQFALFLNGTVLQFYCKDLSGNLTTATASGFTAVANTRYFFGATITGTTITFAVNGTSYSPSYGSQVLPSTILIPNAYIGQFKGGTPICSRVCLARSRSSLRFSR